MQRPPVPLDTATPVVAPVVDDESDDAGDGPVRRRIGPEPQPRRPLSEILMDIADDVSRQRVSIGDMIAAVPGRATAALMFLFAAPNAIPAPPGLSALLGLPLVYLASQMMRRRKPWLPKAIEARSIPRSDFAAIVNRAAPWLARAERMLRPRLTPLVSPSAEIAIGLFCMILAIAVALPIPLGNMLPAFAICVMMLGVLERDGLWVALGGVIGLVSLAIVASVVIAAVKLLALLVAQAFG